MPVGKRIQDSIEPVNRNDNHDEARKVEPNDSYKNHDSTSDVISCPRNSVGPSHFKGNLKQYDLEINSALKIFLPNIQILPQDLQWQDESTINSFCF